MVDLLAGARLNNRTWLDKEAPARHAGLGVLLSTSSGRVRIKAMKPGYGDTARELMRCRRKETLVLLAVWGCRV